jgi:hypothetical protein
MAHQPEQFKEVEAFFFQVLKGELDSDKAQTKAMEIEVLSYPSLSTTEEAAIQAFLPTVTNH